MNRSLSLPCPMGRRRVASSSVGALRAGRGWALTAGVGAAIRDRGTACLRSLASAQPLPAAMVSELHLARGPAASPGMDSLKGPERPCCAAETLGAYGHALMCKCTSATQAAPPWVPAACQQSLCIALGSVRDLPSLKGESPGAAGDCMCLGMHQCVLC